MPIIHRVDSGIYGLDELIQGGFPKPSIIYIGGEPGTGKTTFVMQSLFHGAAKGETSLYITGVSEPAESVKRFMSVYSFFDEKFIENGKLVFEDLGWTLKTDTAERALGAVEPIIQRVKPSRVAVDPLPPIYMFSSETDYRKYLYGLFNILKKLNVLALVTGERMPNVAEIESYMADGVIMMSLQSLDTPFTYKTLIQIKKMRGTRHTKDALLLDITDEGMKIFRVDRIA